MTGLRAFLAAILLVMALARADLFRRRAPVPTDLLWLLVVGLGAGAAVFAFGVDGPFLPMTCALLALAAVEGRWFGQEATGPLRLRRRGAPAVGAFFGLQAPVLGTFLLLLFIDRRLLRRLLLLLTRAPLGLSPLDVDQIVPPPLTRRRREEGMTLVETIVAMALIGTISATIFTAVAGRAAYHRQIRETSIAREAAVSELERLTALPWSTLLDRDGAEFPVPGGTTPGRVEVEIRDGVASVRVTVPRRSGTAIEIETLRAGRRP